MLVKCDIKRTLLKNLYMALRDRLQRNIKMFSNTLRHMGGKKLKRILTNLYFFTYNEINLYHSDIQKHIFYEKWFK